MRIILYYLVSTRIYNSPTRVQIISNNGISISNSISIGIS